MQIIDARSGREVQVGDVIEYGPRDRKRLVALRNRGLKIDALIDYQERGVVRTQWVPLTLRFLHPRYLFRWVAFIPS